MINVQILAVSSLLFLTKVNGEDRKFCNEAGTKCETFQSDLNAAALGNIRSWLDKMSAKTPVKSCLGNPRIPEQPVNPDGRPEFLRTEECLPMNKGLKRETYSFSGKIIDNKFEGAGKFKYGALDDSGAYLETCVYRSQILTSRAKTVTAKFVDGKPDGLSKIELENGDTLIAQTKNGHLAGLLRRWATNETMINMIGYRYYSDSVGFCWSYEQNVWMFSDCSSKGYDSGSLESLLIFEDGRIVTGEYMFYHKTIINARYARIDTTTIDDCILYPTWSVIEGDEFTIDLNQNSTFIKYNKDENEEQGKSALCYEKSDWNSQNPDEEIQNYLEKFDNFDNEPFKLVTKFQTNFELEKSLRFISDIQYHGNRTFSCILNENQDHRTNFTVRLGQVNENEGKISGCVQLMFDIETSPKDSLFRARFRSIRGYMRNNVLFYKAFVHLEDNRYWSVAIKDNVLHGPAILIGIRVFLPFPKEYGYENDNSLDVMDTINNLGCISNFVNGRLSGLTYIPTIGDGFLYGELDPTNSSFTGDKMAFIYPYYQMALYGRWENGFMRSAREVKLVGTRCNGHGLKEIKFTEPDLTSPEFFYSPPTNTSFGGGPFVMDPYERETARLGNSTMPHGGEGVFAIRDLKAHTLVNYYDGFVYRNNEEKRIYEEMYLKNETLSDDRRRHGKKYSIGIGALKGRDIQIPWHVDQPDSWHPTLGPKVNSQFFERGQNAQYSPAEHPRWGYIQGVRIFKDVKAGEELFTDYGYGLGGTFPSDFPWYQEARKKLDKELAEEKKEKQKLEKEKAKQEKELKKSKKKAKKNGKKKADTKKK